MRHMSHQQPGVHRRRGEGYDGREGGPPDDPPDPKKTSRENASRQAGDWVTLPLSHSFFTGAPLSRAACHEISSTIDKSVAYGVAVLEVREDVVAAVVRGAVPLQVLRVLLAAAPLENVPAVILAASAVCRERGGGVGPGVGGWTRVSPCCLDQRPPTKPRCRGRSEKIGS